MKKVLNTVIILGAFVCLMFNVAEAGTTEQTVAIEPGSYEVESDYMEGNFKLHENNGKYEASINLTQIDGWNIAGFEGPAVVAGNKITIKSTEGDGAVILLTINRDVIVIEANEEARAYTGLNATFDGTYKYSMVQEKKTVSKATEQFLLYRWGDDPEAVNEKYNQIAMAITSISDVDLINNMEIFINGNSMSDLETLKSNENKFVANQRGYALTGDVEPNHAENVSILEKRIEYSRDGSEGLSFVYTVFQFSEDALGLINVLFAFEPDAGNDDEDDDSRAQKTAFMKLFGALSGKYGRPSVAHDSDLEYGWLVGGTKIYLDGTPFGSNCVELSYMDEAFEDLQYVE